MNTDFQYFLAMAEERNFTRAAERLYISQPALTKYIKRLEERLGVTLFDRSYTPVRLTYAGQLYLKYAHSMIRHDEELAQAFQEIKENDRGQIRLGITNFRSSILLPDVLPLFRKRYSKVDIVLTEGRSRFLGNELSSDRIDFCITNKTDIINYTEFNSETIFCENIHLAVANTYPRLSEFCPDPVEVARRNNLGDYPIIDIRQLIDEPFYMMHSEQGLAYIIENFLGVRGIRLNNVMRTVNLLTAINLAAAGVGFSFIPDIPFKRGMFPRNLLYFRISETDIMWDITVFYQKNRTLSSHSRAFIDIMRERYGNES